MALSPGECQALVLVRGRAAHALGELASGVSLISEKRTTVTTSSSAHRAAVDLLEEVDRLVQAAELRVVVLDVARGELLDALDLDLVDHGQEDLLARRVLEARP